MSELSLEDLQSILQEQKELRLRLVALDRKIETLRVAKIREPIGDFVENEVAAPTIATTTPPPLPFSRPVVEPVAAEPIQTPPMVEPTAAKSSWEFQLGTVWLVRIGIVILLTGLVFLGNYAYRYIVPLIGPWVKLTLLYSLGGALAWLGARLEKSGESLRNYGRVLLAGGAAMLYYTTYGATFVEKLRVIDSPLIGGFLLLAVGGAVVWLAEKRQAQSVALTAILLSYYTSAINPLGLFSLYSSLLLTVAAVYFLLRYRWTTLSFLSLVGTYGSYAFWRFYRSGELVSFQTQLPNHVWQGAVFLFGYWILFTAAVFLSRSSQFTPGKRTPFLTINNAAFFGLVVQILNANHPSLTGRFALVFGTVLLSLSWLAKRRQNEDLFLDGAYLIQGLGVLTFGFLTELNGYQLSLALAIQGTLMLFSINRRHGWIYEIGAGIVTLLSLAVSLATNSPHPAVFWSLAGLLIADAWLIANYKKRETRPAFNWQAAGYSLIAIWNVYRIISVNFPGTRFELVAAVLLMFLGTFIRLRELAITSQFFVLLSVVPYIQGATQHDSLTLLAVIFLPLGLVHWWKYQKERDPWQLGQIVFSFLFLAAASRWTAGRWSGTHLEFYLNLLAVAVLVYGAITGTYLLALGGQILVFGMAGLFFFDAFFHDYPRLWPTLCLGAITLNLYLLHFLSHRFPTDFQAVLRVIQRILSVLLFAMLAVWGWSYVAAPYRILYFAGLATVLLLIADYYKRDQPRRVLPLLGYSCGYALLGLVIFWNDWARQAPASWIAILALTLFVGNERIIKYRFPDLPNLAPVRRFLIVAAVSGFWLEWDRWIEFNQSPFPKTLAWATLGTVALCAGLALRERTYRICGLSLLALATIRIFAKDIWGLDPIFRILSFIVLGVVLLALGFIYNKFADKLKEWL